jgi:hypothetical protein
MDNGTKRCIQYSMFVILYYILILKIIYEMKFIKKFKENNQSI